MDKKKEDVVDAKDWSFRKRTLEEYLLRLILNVADEAKRIVVRSEEWNPDAPEDGFFD